MKGPHVAVPFVVVLSAFGAGCGGSVDFHPSAPAPRTLALREPNAVEVVTAPAPGRGGVVIGTLEAKSSAHPPTGDGHEDLLARLRQAAGEHGCDAIALSAIEQALYATSNGTPLYRGHQTAACIVYP